jgi:site-specific DNA-methyltransferase (adenine-specific)
MKTNNIYNENCLVTMAAMPDNYIDLVVTSPPYDNLRDYNGYTFDFEAIAKELYRVTKDGGVVVWIINDATINGSETGTSFRQALYFKEIGFNLHDTMIWNKQSFSAPGALKNRYAPVFEYMFILSKGKPKTFNPLMDRKTTYGNTIRKRSTKRLKDGSFKQQNGIIKLREYGQRFNVWTLSGFRGISKHPAVFPVQLVKDHIISWSNEGDIVYDPFMGSGTTALAARELNRLYIGSETSDKYCKLIQERLL